MQVYHAIGFRYELVPRSPALRLISSGDMFLIIVLMDSL